MFKPDIYPRLLEPTIDPQHWAFSLGGTVRHPLILAYADMDAFPRSEVTCAALAAGAPFDESQIEFATWRGVALRSLLDEVEISASARYAILHTSTGYSASLALPLLENALLAFEQDGKPLTPSQGFPARLVVPGAYRDKMPRWITRIEFAESRRGFWEKRGWGNEDTPAATAAFTAPGYRAIVPREIELHGFAFSPLDDTLSIEISVDHADWVPVAVVPAPAAQIVRWSTPWSAPHAGSFLMRVRAVSARPAAGSDAQTPALPHAQTFHQLVIHVTE